MTRQMPGRAQIAFAKDWFEMQGIPAETVDVESYIDSSLSYSENIRNLRRQFGAGKRGMDAPMVVSGLTASECDVAIGNFEEGYNHEVTRDACTCGHPDACEKLEKDKAAKKAARTPAPTGTEAMWRANMAKQQAAEARAAAKPKTEEPPSKKFKTRPCILRPGMKGGEPVYANFTTSTTVSYKGRIYLEKYRYRYGSLLSAEDEVVRVPGEYCIVIDFGEAAGGRYAVFCAPTPYARSTPAQTAPKPHPKPAAAPDLPPSLIAPPELAADVLGGGIEAAKPKPATRTKRKPAAKKPAPDLPPILTAPPELAADVFGGGMGQAPKPKPAARKPKKTAKKPAKPKTRKTAAGTKLTPSQQAYMALNGFVMVKRGGKYVRITG